MCWRFELSLHGYSASALNCRAVFPSPLVFTLQLVIQPVTFHPESLRVFLDLRCSDSMGNGGNLFITDPCKANLVLLMHFLLFSILSIPIPTLDTMIFFFLIESLVGSFNNRMPLFGLYVIKQTLIV